jgi:hypothetical protein
MNSEPSLSSVLSTDVGIPAVILGPSTEVVFYSRMRIAPLVKIFVTFAQILPTPNLKIIDGLKENDFLFWIVSKTRLSLLFELRIAFSPPSKNLLTETCDKI